MLSKTNSVQFSKPVKTVIRLKLFDNLSHILHKWIQRKKKKRHSLEMFMYQILNQM